MRNPAPRGACRTLSRLSVFGLALLAQELREIVVSTRGLPRSAGHLPTAKRLDAYDRARRCAGRSVRVQDAGLDFREEPPDLRRFAAEDSRGEAVVHVVRDLDRVLEVVHRDDRQDRHEELFLVDPVVPRQPLPNPASAVTFAGFFRPISVMIGFGGVRVTVWSAFIPTALDPVKTKPSTSGLSRSSCPTVAPGPVTKLNAPAGRPASRRVSARRRPMNGVSLAGLKTTLLPLINAPVDIPAAIARGKLNGATTVHTPYGFTLERVVSPGMNVPIGPSYPWFRSISTAYQRVKSAASSTSAMAS